MLSITKSISGPLVTSALPPPWLQTYLRKCAEPKSLPQTCPQHLN